MAEFDELKRRFVACVRLVDGTALKAQQAQKHDYYRAQTALFEEFINQAPEVLEALEEREALKAEVRHFARIAKPGFWSSVGLEGIGHFPLMSAILREGSDG